MCVLQEALKQNVSVGAYDIEHPDQLCGMNIVSKHGPDNPLEYLSVTEGSTTKSSPTLMMPRVSLLHQIYWHVCSIIQ